MPDSVPNLIAGGGSVTPSRVPALQPTQRRSTLLVDGEGVALESGEGELVGGEGTSAFNPARVPDIQAAGAGSPAPASVPDLQGPAGSPSPASVPDLQSAGGSPAPDTVPDLQSAGGTPAPTSVPKLID